jgi:hypothetical protein
VSIGTVQVSVGVSAALLLSTPLSVYHALRLASDFGRIDVSLRTINIVVLGAANSSANSQVLAIGSLR